MIDHHDPAECPPGLVDHIAEIEAGWTLPKPWNASDEDAAEAENRRAVIEMLARWAGHGIRVTAG